MHPCFPASWVKAQFFVQHSGVASPGASMVAAPVSLPLGPRSGPRVRSGVPGPWGDFRARLGSSGEILLILCSPKSTQDYSPVRGAGQDSKPASQSRRLSPEAGSPGPTGMGRVPIAHSSWCPLLYFIGHVTRLHFCPRCFIRQPWRGRASGWNTHPTLGH